MTKKHYLLLLTISTIALSTKGQSIINGVEQAAKLNVSEIVSADFFSSGNGNGASPNVDIPIGGTSALAEGIESPEIEVKLRCTTDFNISVSASADNFTYSGSSINNTTMVVKDVLSIIITDNNTGGSINNGLSQYQSINGTNKTMAISDGQQGERTFKFKYKAQPGFNYPAGTYTTDIVYTLSKK